MVMKLCSRTEKYVTERPEYKIHTCAFNPKSVGLLSQYFYWSEAELFLIDRLIMINDLILMTGCSSAKESDILKYDFSWL